MRAIVTCECCGHRQTVARAIRTPESFYLVCHACERSLRVEVTDGDIRAANTSSAKSAGRSR
jgi:transcription elongation factor Elf1